MKEMGKAKKMRLGFLVNMAIAVALLVGGCGGDGSDVPVGSEVAGGDNTPAPEVLAAVAPLFSTNGADWNDYVQGDIDTATDAACDPDVDTSCLHAGEVRVVDTGRISCTGLSASDSLGAFNWVCDDSAGTARFISTGLAEGKNLSDLLDFSTSGWKQNSVIVYDNGTVWGETPPDVWWTNPVAEAGDGTGALDTEKTIYIVGSTVDLSTGYSIGASKVGLVAAPGAIIKGPAAGGSSVISAFGSTGARDFLWLEGKVDATGCANGVYLNTVRFSVLRNVKADNATSYGVYLFQSSDHNTLSGITASNNGSIGIYLRSSSNNTLFNATAAHNGSGVAVDTSSNILLAGIKTSNNGSEGVSLLSSSDCSLADITASSNGTTGVFLASSMNGTHYNVTASNNGSEGVLLGSSDNNTLSNITAVNNGRFGISLSSSSGNTLANITGSDNFYPGVNLSSSSNNYFTGFLKVGECAVSGGTDPGLDTACANNGLSDAELTSGVTLADSFAGVVITDDPRNASDTSGTASYPSDPAAFDWTNFENLFRGWGLDGVFGEASSRGQWIAGSGRIWDWSLLASDSVIREVLPVAYGGYTLTHTWSDSTTTEFLRNAVELLNDGIGNDNTLCESNETCLYTPNMGSYQGHGALVSAGPFTDGVLTGITLLRYENNGR